MGIDDRSDVETTDLMKSDSMSSNTLPVDLEDFFHLLSDTQTRYLLYILTEQGGTITVSEIAEHIPGGNNTVRLHHHILPKLVDFHLIDYETDTGAITPTPICDDLEPALETVKSVEPESVDEFLEQARR